MRRVRQGAYPKETGFDRTYPIRIKSDSRVSLSDAFGRIRAHMYATR